MLAKKFPLYVQFLLVFEKFSSSNTCKVFWNPQASSSEFIYNCKGEASFPGKWIKTPKTAGSTHSWCLPLNTGRQISVNLRASLIYTVMPELHSKNLSQKQKPHRTPWLQIRGLSQGDSVNSVAWLPWLLTVTEGIWGFCFELSVLVVMPCSVLPLGIGLPEFLHFQLVFPKKLAHAFPLSPCTCLWPQASTHQHRLLSLTTKKRKCAHWHVRF